MTQRYLVKELKCRKSDDSDSRIRLVGVRLLKARSNAVAELLEEALWCPDSYRD